MKSLLSLSITFGLISLAPYCNASTTQANRYCSYYHRTINPEQSQDSLQRYVGVYELAPSQQLTISLVTDTLYILPPNETTKAALKPAGDNKFVVIGEEAHVWFRQNSVGQITAVEIQFGNGVSATGKKL